MPIIKIAIRSPDSENKIHLSIEVNKVFFFFLAEKLLRENNVGRMWLTALAVMILKNLLE